ncbi:MULTISPECIES: c-type cytochrome [unclassified Achromobacter]|uniref:c-type cytochrome n=1 Tax=unclassified Achromobacter TaxID=2626865 RepID=UPI000B51D112|nr:MULTISPECIES: c-type cytochrome [unclassified Achromobacter]OWT72815.1 cytochrome C [Achromobacter sp. HZ34]OWT74034.1 cytochrome C [Achromobacter sp. HZ28]
MLFAALVLVVLGLATAVVAAWSGWPMPGWPVDRVPWPFAWRYDADLPVSPYVWHKLWLAVASATGGVILVWRGAWHRRWRWGALAAGALLLVNASWPRPALYLAPALPTSFERSSLAYTPTSLLQGRVAYEAQCASCHGVAADGQGPRAAALALWPSTLGEALFQNRLEGEIYWRILHHPPVGAGRHVGGERVTDANASASAGASAAGGEQGNTGHAGHAGHAGGATTSSTTWVPAPDADAAWRVVDYLRAIAYGASGGVGMPSVPAPEIALSCRGRGRVSLSSLRGQPVRIVAHGASTEEDERDDPRLVTVVLTRGAAGRPVGNVHLDPLDPRDAVDAECSSADADAWQAYAFLAGVTPDNLAGAQFLVDRQGWLRARHAGGAEPAWTSGDDVCGPSGRLHVALPVQGLAQILKAMDASPIAPDRYRRG